VKNIETADCIAIIILAAGLGTRMKSDRAKVLHEINGIPMICYVVETAKTLTTNETIVVIGYQADQVQAAVADYTRLKFANQDQQLGTGHAVKCALPEVSVQIEHVVILCGDVPLLKPATVTLLLNEHLNAKRDVTVVAVEALDPTGYGRIVMGADRKVCGIVEEADASEDEKKIRIVNAGIYCVNRKFLQQAIEKLQTNNAQGEFYLTDIVAMAHQENRSVGFVMANDPDEVAGINTLTELQAAEAVLKGRST
jgi:UDP-N-acetylglucosamine diphosphorylase/glucosamine-1-phosphate N-acetyltransferase